MDPELDGQDLDCCTRCPAVDEHYNLRRIEAMLHLLIGTMDWREMRPGHQHRQSCDRLDE